MDKDREWAKSYLGYNSDYNFSSNKEIMIVRGR